MDERCLSVVYAVEISRMKTAVEVWEDRESWHAFFPGSFAREEPWKKQGWEAGGKWKVTGFFTAQGSQCVLPNQSQVKVKAPRWVSQLPNSNVAWHFGIFAHGQVPTESMKHMADTHSWLTEVINLSSPVANSPRIHRS